MGQHQDVVAGLHTLFVVCSDSPSLLLSLPLSLSLVMTLSLLVSSSHRLALSFSISNYSDVSSAAAGAPKRNIGIAYCWWCLALLSVDMVMVVIYAGGDDMM